MTVSKIAKNTIAIAMAMIAISTISTQGFAKELKEYYSQRIEEVCLNGYVYVVVSKYHGTGVTQKMIINKSGEVVPATCEK